MSGSVKRLSGQTAVEMLCILSVILIGVVVVVPIYTQESGDSVMLAAVRDAASQAAGYIDAGVISYDSMYSDLNDIIKDYTGYQSAGFRFVGIRVQSSDNTGVLILIKFEHDLARNSTRDRAIATAIGNFLKNYLSNVRGFAIQDEKLYQGGRLVEFNVTVGETWEVIS